MFISSLHMFIINSIANINIFADCLDYADRLNIQTNSIHTCQEQAILKKIW